MSQQREEVNTLTKIYRQMKRKLICVSVTATVGAAVLIALGPRLVWLTHIPENIPKFLARIDRRP